MGNYRMHYYIRQGAIIHGMFENVTPGPVQRTGLAQ